jgi:uracil-DNA glycosylase
LSLAHCALSGHPGYVFGMATPEPRTAAAFVPKRPTLPKLQAAAAGCTACHLHELGTQTVFGEGPRSAELMLVGEQPGDKEDLAGEPFVGPAGGMLDRALEEAGIARDQVYVTNVVKHFKWEARGKRRIHKKPNLSEIAACKPWLEAELAVVKPRALVCLGATAAQALLGRDFKVSVQRGELVDSELADIVSATIHPSSILRGPPGDRAKALEGLTADLRKIQTFLTQRHSGAL